MMMRDFTCTLTHEEYGGWKAIRLSNGIIDLFIVPELGGRTIQLRLGAQEFLYVNPRHRGQIYSEEENCLRAGWKNYGGSKVWPAPQGWESKEQWPGPPDPVLDGGNYKFWIVDNKCETAAAALESPPDGYTGLTFSRTIRIFENSATVLVHHTMRNSSPRIVQWSIWQVTQVAAGNGISVLAPTSEYRQMMGDVPYEDLKLDPERKLLRLGYADRVAKFAVRPEEGWMATLNHMQLTALVETFQIFPGFAYPDDAPLEFWVNGRGSFTIHADRVQTEHDPNGYDPYFETEILSPLVELRPGEGYNFVTRWHCTATDGEGICAVNPWAAVVNPLQVRRMNGALKITGGLGMFQTGLLEVLCLNRHGQSEAVHQLGPVTPLTPCTIATTIPDAEGCSAIVVRLRGTDGELLGTVAQCSAT